MATQKPRLPSESSTGPWEGFSRQLRILHAISLRQGTAKAKSRITFALTPISDRKAYEAGMI